MYYFILRNQARDAKVAYLDSAFAIEEYVVQLDIPVEHRPAVAVSDRLHNFLEYISSLVLCQMLALLDQVVQVASARVLHDHHDVLLVFEYLIEPDYIGVADLLEDVDLLEDLLPGILVLELAELDHLDGHELASQLVYGQVHLPEGSITNLLHELVEVQASRREL